MFTERDYFWMRHAISLAETAAKNQEVPIGAVLTLNDELISEGLNCPIHDCDPSAHAEMIALRTGGKRMNNYRLVNTTLYVTLEPCVMCVGAIVHARVQRVVFGAHDPKAGAVASVFGLGETEQFNHRVKYEGGLLSEECGKLLKEFFQKRR